MKRLPAPYQYVLIFVDRMTFLLLFLGASTLIVWPSEQLLLEGKYFERT